MDSLKLSMDVCNMFSSQVNKITNAAETRYQAIIEEEERLKNRSRAPRFTNKNDKVRRKIASRMFGIRQNASNLFGVKKPTKKFQSPFNSKFISNNGLLSTNEKTSADSTKNSLFASKSKSGHSISSLFYETPKNGIKGLPSLNLRDCDPVI